MAGRRTVYLIALMGGLVFYWAYREWLSWFFLLLMLGLPWFSLLLSLPAMLGCRGVVEAPGAVLRGEAVEPLWRGHSTLPLPALRGKLLVTHSVTGKKEKINSGDSMTVAHCGLLNVSLHRPRCCDYLGLFSLPVRKREGAQVVVRPVPVPPEHPPDMSRCQIQVWRPKAGGGFSENHELRLYRPGDNLRQVHWKLSAKTGKLIVREPMEAISSRVLLTMELRGSGAELDSKLGRLLWMSRYLLEKELPHRIHCLTGAGMVTFDVGSEVDVQPAIDSLLRAPLARAEDVPDYMSANWRYHIGGDGNAC